MRAIIVCVFTLTFFIFSSEKKAEISSLSLKTIVMTHKGDTLKIKTVITNNSKNAISYLTMTCSWWKFYEVDAKGVMLRNMRCNSNIPTIVTIGANKSHEEILDMKIVDKDLFLSKPKFKVVFEFIPIREGDILEDVCIQFLTSKKHGELIWSDDYVFN